MNEQDDRALWEMHSALAVLEDFAENTAELEDLARLLVETREAKRRLSDVERFLEKAIGERMSSKNLAIDGVGMLERNRRKSYTKWDRDALLRDVLDSKLVNTETGEMVDESPLEKVLAVWSLGAPRRTILRERGLQPDEYAQVDDSGDYSVQIK